jgi:pimeloyl-ACP methyl ester carboxylesterase
MLASSTIQGPQGTLAVYSAGGGEGLPVLFLHADLGRAEQWQEVMTSIASSRRVVAFDFRGQGESEPAQDGDCSYGGRAADIGAVLDGLSLRRVVIVSHSGGSAAALSYAADSPGRVAGILMVDPVTDPRALPQDVRDGFVSALKGPDSLNVLKAYYASIAGPSETVKERVLADVERVHASARAAIGMAVADWVPEPTLFAFQGPMLILATPANDHAGALYRLRTTIPHRIIADSGHWIQLDQPAAVEHAVRDFLASVEGGQHG